MQVPTCHELGYTKNSISDLNLETTTYDTQSNGVRNNTQVEPRVVLLNICVGHHG